MKTKILLLLSLFIGFVSFAQKKQWTLKECVAHALENNISIKQQKLNVNIANANVKDAKGNFLPVVNAANTTAVGFGSVIDGDTNSRLGSTTSLSGSINLGSNITIFNGFRNLNTKKQAFLNVEGSKLDLLQIENDVALNVINAYLNVLFAKENLIVANTQSAISKEQITRVKAQFEAGATAKGALLNIEATAATDLQNVILQENSLNLAILQLTQLLQVSNTNFDVTPIDVSIASNMLLYNNTAVVFEKALSNRPEIERAKLNIDNADLGIQIAKSFYMPTVVGSYAMASGYFYNLKTNAANVDFFTQLDNRLNHNISLGVNVPIFNGFKTDASVEIAKLNKELSIVSLEQQKLILEQTIEQAFLDATAAAKTYEVSQISLKAQKEAFKNAQVSYDYGSMTQFDFDQVRGRLVNAEASLIRAKYDYIFKSKVLKFYAGQNIVN